MINMPNWWVHAGEPRRSFESGSEAWELEESKDGVTFWRTNLDVDDHRQAAGRGAMEGAWVYTERDSGI